MSIFTSCWQSIFLLTYGGWVVTFSRKCGYWGVHVCLDLSVCLMEAGVVWTQTHSQRDDLFISSSGVMSAAWTGFVNWPTCTLTKALVNLPAPCNCSPPAVTYHGHLPHSRDIHGLASCTVQSGAMCEVVMSFCSHTPTCKLCHTMQTLSKVPKKQVRLYLWCGLFGSTHVLSVLQVACLIRVPTEVVKQRTQASPSSTTYHMLLATLKEEVHSNQWHVLCGFDHHPYWWL